MFNEGQTPDRTTFAFGAVDLGFLGETFPVLSVTYSVGFELYKLTEAGPVTIHVFTSVKNVGVEIGSGAKNNTLTRNTGRGNFVDGFDGNFSCDFNQWIGNVFGTVNQMCVDDDATIIEIPPVLGATSNAH